MVRFLLDEHVPGAVANGLRLRGVNVQTLADGGLLGADDVEILTFAAQEDRVVFTQDQDFLRVHSLGIAHSGIAYARQGTSIGYIVRGLMLIRQILEPEDMRNELEFL